jgi:hypothetical protein
MQKKQAKQREPIPTICWTPEQLQNTSSSKSLARSLPLTVGRMPLKKQKNKKRAFPWEVRIDFFLPIGALRAHIIPAIPVCSETLAFSRFGS